MQIQKVLMAVLILVLGLTFTVSNIPLFSWTGEGEYSSEGYDRDGGKFIWKRTIEEEIQGIDTVVFKTVNGFIDVDPHQDSSASTVNVDAEIVIKKGFFTSQDKVMKVKEKIDIVVERDNDHRLIVRVDWPKRGFMGGPSPQINMRVKIPNTLSIDVESVNGWVTADNITKPVRMRTVNGSLKASDCPGPIHAKSTNGSVTLRETEKRVEAETVNGSIKLDMVSSPQEGCKLKTVNGSITVDAPKNVVLDLENSNGSIDFDTTQFSGSKQKHRVSGTLYGGGVEIAARSVNGKITIQ